MLTLLIKTCGWTVAHTPEALWRGVSALLGDLLLVLLPRRRRVSLSNLHHAFPERPLTWHWRIARESSRRLIETGLYSLAAPYFSEARLRRSFQMSPRAQTAARAHHEDPAPSIIATNHSALWESLVCIALLSPVPVGNFGVIYRPLKQAAVDAYVKRTRERFGLRLLSRRAGFQTAMHILRDRGSIGLLFDQSAGDEGALTLLFGRVCATSELAGLLTAKLAARLWALQPVRTGFWRATIDIEELPHDRTTAGVTLVLNRWLEQRLSSSDDACASWLWAHDRWRTQDRPARRFRLEQKRDLLAADLTARGLAELPRRTRVYVRLPNWLGDVVMVLPLLRALRQGRPDAALTLIGKPAFAPLVAAWGVADRYESLPARGRGYFRHFRRLRHEFPDTYLLFTHSWRGDLEAWLTQTPQRFGLRRAGRRRVLLTHTFSAPPELTTATTHQVELWTAYLRHFGLEQPISRAPLPRPAPAAGAPIGLIAGSENTPAKRWPVAHWRALVAALPQERFVLFGTANDRAITTEIARGFGEDRIEDLAGRTDLPQFMERLRGCALLVSNDTGGMHLANALGVPVVALFGPTNPLRTGPIFEGVRVILQPPGGAPTGGGDLAGLEPSTVAAAVARLRAGTPAAVV